MTKRLYDGRINKKAFNDPKREAIYRRFLPRIDDLTRDIWFNRIRDANKAQVNTWYQDHIMGNF